MFLRRFQVQNEHLKILRERFNLHFKRSPSSRKSRWNRWIECVFPGWFLNKPAATSLTDDDELLDIALYYFESCNFKCIRPDTLYAGIIQFVQGSVPNISKNLDGNSIIFYLTDSFQEGGGGIVFRGDLINKLNLVRRDYILIHLERVACLQNISPRDRSRIARSF